MSVVIETTLGTVTVDLYISSRPRACLNFLKLCKMKYYNFNLFHTISRGFIAQTGDPTGTRSGGESIFGVISGPEKRYFECENEPRIKHTKMGLISFVGNDEHMIGSQFFITLGDDLIYLDEHHCVFGEVVEGFDILEAINEVICDTDDRPYQDVRITHTVVLDDPFPNPKNLKIPSRSPSPSADRLQGGRIAPDEDVDESEGKTAAEISEMQAEREAKARATILEMVGDIPDADMAPPENVLFVCKLNPVTTDDDLEVIFNRFGKIKSCEVIRDRKTGDSLQYAFIEFEDQKSCEDAYFKMDNILIDDRRIHVDFSQSVSKVRWMGKGRGVKHYDERGKLSNREDRNIGKGDYKQKNYYKSDRNRNKSPDNKDNGRYSPYKASERNKQSRQRRSRSRSNNKNYDRPKTPVKERDDRSRASYSKGKSSKDCSDRNLSSNKKHTSHRDRSRSELFSIDSNSRSKRCDEKSEGRDRYDKSRRNRKENPQSERSNNNNRGIGKSRRNRSKSVESSTDRKNNVYQKTVQSKSEKNHKSKRRRSSSHSDSEDGRRIQVDKKKKERSINDEDKKGKSKYREKSNITSSDSEDESKDQKISKGRKRKSYNSKKHRHSSDSDEHKRNSKKKSKSYQSISSSDLDETRYKKKSKPRQSSTASSSDSDSDKNSKRKKEKRKKKKYASDSE